MNHDYNFTISLGKREIEAKAFTLNDYLGLVVARKTGMFKEFMYEVFKECTGLDMFKDLSKPEAEYVMFLLWANSLGEVNHEAEYVCECGEEFSVPMNFNHIQIDKPIGHREIINNLTINFKPVTIFCDTDKIKTFLECMDYLILDDNQIFIKDLNEEEMGDLQSIITMPMVDKVCEELLKPTIHMGVPVKCPSCGKYHVHEFNSLGDFMEILK